MCPNIGREDIMSLWLDTSRKVANPLLYLHKRLLSWLMSANSALRTFYISTKLLQSFVSLAFIQRNLSTVYINFQSTHYLCLVLDCIQFFEEAGTMDVTGRFLPTSLWRRLTSSSRDRSSSSAPWRTGSMMTSCASSPTGSAPVSRTPPGRSGRTRWTRGITTSWPA